MYLSKAICFTLKDWYFLQKNFMLSGEADKEKFEFWSDAWGEDQQ